MTDLFQKTILISDWPNGKHFPNFLFAIMDYKLSLLFKPFKYNNNNNNSSSFIIYLFLPNTTQLLTAIYYTNYRSNFKKHF